MHFSTKNHLLYFTPNSKKKSAYTFILHSIHFPFISYNKDIFTIFLFKRIFLLHLQAIYVCIPKKKRGKELSVSMHGLLSDAIISCKVSKALYRINVSNNHNGHIYSRIIYTSTLTHISQFFENIYICRYHSCKCKLLYVYRENHFPSNVFIFPQHVIRYLYIGRYYDYNVYVIYV